VTHWAHARSTLSSTRRRTRTALGEALTLGDELGASLVLLLHRRRDWEQSCLASTGDDDGATLGERPRELRTLGKSSTELERRWERS
jgi:hypothetical protein